MRKGENGACTPLDSPAVQHMLFRERTLLWPWGPMLCFELNLERIGGGETTPWDFKSLVGREWTGIKTIIKRKSRQSVLDIIVRKGYKDLLNGDLIIQVRITYIRSKCLIRGVCLIRGAQRLPLPPDGALPPFRDERGGIDGPRNWSSFRRDRRNRKPLPSEKANLPRSGVLPGCRRKLIWLSQQAHGVPPRLPFRDERGGISD